MHATTISKPIALPYPQSKIESGEIYATALISIVGSADTLSSEEVSFFGTQFEDVLYLNFDDIPFESFRGSGTIFYGPNMEDLRSSLSFAKKVKCEFDSEDLLIAVHCQAGKSRSAAIALAINIQDSGGNEEEVVRNLLLYDPNKQMCFNPRIIEIADILLNGEGKINAALEKLCPAYVTWKKYWSRYENSLLVSKTPYPDLTYGRTN